MLILLRNNLINLKNNQIWSRYHQITNYYDLIVNNGDGDGHYLSSSVINISGTGSGTFSEWTGDTATIANINAESTTITLTADMEVTATYTASVTADGWDDNMNEEDGVYQ